jgi:hypothetical protein
VAKAADLLPFNKVLQRLDVVDPGAVGLPRLQGRFVHQQHGARSQLEKTRHQPAREKTAQSEGHAGIHQHELGPLERPPQ